MRKQIENYFQFTRSERIGIFILLFLSLLTWFAFPIYTRFFVDQSKTDFTKFKTEIALLEMTIKASEDKNGNSFTSDDNFIKSAYSKKYNKSKKKAVITPFAFNPNTISQADLLVMGIPKNAIDNLVKFRNKGAKFYKKADFKKVYGITDDIYSTIENFIQLPVNSTKKLEPAKYPELKEEKRALTPFEFDPNTISKAEMRRMGLSDKVAATIENFRSKGGTFRRPEDLSRIYGLKEEDYNKIQSFITIDEKAPPKKEIVADAKSKFVTKKKEVQPIDINEATMEDWSTLNGIGAGRSKMIIAYREKLGGFYTIDQVRETFGLPDSTFQQIKPFLRIDASNEKIDLNTVTLDGLSQHPYLNFRQAKAIINYRSNHGEFESVESLAAVRALSKEDVDKIAPYLRVN